MKKNQLFDKLAKHTFKNISKVYLINDTMKTLKEKALVNAIIISEKSFLILETQKSYKTLINLKAKIKQNTICKSKDKQRKYAPYIEIKD